MRRSSPLLTAIALFALSACGSKGPTTVVPPAVPATVSVAGGGTLLVPLQTAQLVATPRDASGNALTGQTITWAALDPTVATVSGSGLVTAVARGSTTITATTAGINGTALVTVIDGGLVGPAGGQVTASGGNVVLQVPAQALITNTAISVGVTANPPTAPTLVPGTAFDIGPIGATFRSAATLMIHYDPAVLAAGANPPQLRVQQLSGTTWVPILGSTVNTTTHVAMGAITSTGTFALVEVPVPVANLIVTASKTTLNPGDTVQFTATPKDVSNNTLTGRTVTWISTVPAVASVSSTGLVTALTVGTTTIRATCEGVVTNATVTVPAVASVVVGAPTTTFNVGDAVQFTATPKDAQGNALTGHAVTWLSTIPTVASVSATGLVTALTAGGTTIRATSDGASMDVPITVSNATLVASHFVVQQGLAIALASTVLQSQLIVLGAMGSDPPPVTMTCTANPGGSGSWQLLSAHPVPPAMIGIYFDAACTRPYMVETVTQFTVADKMLDAFTTASVYTITATALYTGPTGTTLGTMSFQEHTDATLTEDLIVAGLGTFVPADASPSSSLGLNCAFSGNDLAHSPCEGGIVQNFSALAAALGSVTMITLDATNLGGVGPISFTGPSVLTSGPLSSLALSEPTSTSMIINGGSTYGTAFASGSAGNFSLFPPTPTGWTVTDAGHDQMFSISVVDNVTRNLAGTVKQISTGATLVTFALDQSGTGTITYSDGSTAKVTSWLVEK